MSNYLILGGAGFIGYHLAKTLSKNKNNQIDIIDNFVRGKKDNELSKLVRKKNVSLKGVDLVNNSNNKFKNKYHYIFNLAAIIGVRNVIKFPQKVLKNNFILQKHAIDIATKQTRLKKFIFFSTSEVYAGSNFFFKNIIPSPEKTPLTINELKDKRTTYMLSKIYGEALCYHSNLPFIILRPHNIYGERMGMDHVIPELLKKIYNSNKSKKLKVFTQNHSRSFCYIDDAVSQILDLTHSKKSKDVFNIGNDKKELIIKNLAKLCMEILNEKRKIVPINSSHNSPKRRCPSMTKTFKVIKRRKFTPLRDGIENVNKWYKYNKLI